MTNPRNDNKQSSFLFRYRRALCSEHGPPSPTRRHVLLTLSMHMDAKGGSCFPSEKLLADETALSDRCVGQHLEAAAKEGWVDRHMRGTTRGWRQWHYQAVIPPGADVPLDADAPEGGSDAPLHAPELGSHANEVAPEPDALAPEPDDTSTRRRFALGRHEDVNEGVKNKRRRKPLRCLPEDIELARFMDAKVKAILPGARDPDFNKWADTIRLMRERDNRTHEEIRELFVWANGDDFWCSNIKCPEKLRKQWETLAIQQQRNRGKRNERYSETVYTTDW